MNVLLVLPLILPLTFATLSLLVWARVRVQRWLAVVGMAALLGAGVTLLIALWRGDQIFVSQIGSWPFPFGITLVADLLSAIMVVLAGLIGLAVALFSVSSIDSQRESFGYYPLLHLLLMGVCGAFLTGDIFNLYVWFEVMLMSSFVLLALGGEPEQLRGAIVYVSLNLISSAFFLAGVGILYGVVGTLNMADLAVKLSENPAHAGLATVLAMLFLIAFGIKAALFPLFFWLPASYHTPPVVVTALFSGLLTKVGVYALFRLFSVVFTQDAEFTHGLFLVIAGLTMVTGVLGAVAQYDIRRLLSFHIISQIGYLLMGLGLYTSSAMAAAIFFMIHVVLAKSTLFLVAGVIERLRGTFDLKRLGGLYTDHPGLSVLFLISALSLAGIPPLPGFFAKLALIHASLATGSYAIVATALVVSLLTLFSMIKIWSEAFWKANPTLAATDDEHHEVDSPIAKRRCGLGMLLPIVSLSLLIVGLSLVVEPVFGLASRAADQLFDRQAYIRAVQGDAP